MRFHSTGPTPDHRRHAGYKTSYEDSGGTRPNPIAPVSPHQPTHSYWRRPYTPGPMRMDNLTNLSNRLLEHPMRGRIGHHERGETV